MRLSASASGAFASAGLTAPAMGTSAIPPIGTDHPLDPAHGAARHGDVARLGLRARVAHDVGPREREEHEREHDLVSSR